VYSDIFFLFPRDIAEKYEQKKSVYSVLFPFRSLYYPALSPLVFIPEVLLLFMLDQYVVPSRGFSLLICHLLPYTPSEPDRRPKDKGTPRDSWLAYIWISH
jgi:hypothetical protein